MMPLRAKLPQRLQRTLRAPLGAEAIRDRQKVGLEDRLQHQLRRHLHHPVPDRRDAQRPLPSVSLRDVPAQHHPGPVLLRTQGAAELIQHPLDPIPLDLGDRLLVHARRAAVRPHSPPRFPQDVTPVEVVVQRVKTPPSRPFGRTPQPSLQSSHFLARLAGAGVVRSARGGHSLALTCSDDLTTAGTLPSRRVLRRDDPRYYDPLGLPLRSGRLRLRLIRRALPRRGPRRRVSRVPHRSLHACCAPYPAGTTRALRF